MAEIKWIKLSVNMFDDEKIKLIRTMPEGENIIIIWVQLLCLAGKINDNGLVYMGQNLAYSDEMLATIMSHPVNTMRIALSTLEQFEMIEMNNQGVIDISNWDKHQNIDGMEKIRLQGRERKRRHDLKKRLTQLGHDPNHKDVPKDVDELEDYVGNVTVTFGNATEEDKNRLEENKNKNIDNKQLESDFEILWKLYPNKKGKSKAFTAYKKAIKDGTANKEIQDGIVSYKKEIEVKGTEQSFVAHGSTWFNQQRWEDDYDHTAPKPNKSFNRRQSDHQEIIPSWMNKHTPVEQTEPSDDSEFDIDDMRKRLDELLNHDEQDDAPNE